MLVDFARDPSQMPIIQGLEFFNRLNGLGKNKHLQGVCSKRVGASVEALLRRRTTMSQEFVGPLTVTSPQGGQGGSLGYPLKAGH